MAWNMTCRCILQSWLDFGHLLFIFLILAAFWLSESGLICDFVAFLEHMGVMVWNLAWLCLLTTFESDQIWTQSPFWHRFDLVKQVKSGVSRNFPRTVGENGLNLTCWCILTTFGTDYILVAFVDCPHFGDILTSWNRWNLRFPAFFTKHGRKFGWNLVCW